MLPHQDLGSQSEVIWAIGCSESALQHNPRWFGPLFDVGQSILPHQALLRAHLGDDGREHVLGLLDVAVACKRPGVASVRSAWVLHPGRGGRGLGTQTRDVLLGLRDGKLQGHSVLAYSCSRDSPQGLQLQAKRHLEWRER